ncbi:MAG: anti-sigma factor domain-containing protein [Thermotaleaceae bacterium]
MVYKGCVVKIEQNFAIVLTNGTQYLKVIKKEGLCLGKEILFVEDDIYRENRTKLRSLGRMAAVLAILILSMSSLGKLHPWFALNSVAAVVSIDINPSLELEIDKENKILRGIPINEEARQLLEDDLKGMAVEDAVLQIIDRARALAFLTQEKNAVLISTAVLKEERYHKQLEGEIEKKLEAEESFQGIAFTYVEGSKEDFKKAREEKISLGKYEVFKQAEKEQQPITLEEIKNMKVQDMLNKNVGRLKADKVPVIEETNKKEKGKKAQEKLEEKKAAPLKREDIKEENPKKEEIRKDSKDQAEQNKNKGKEKQKEAQELKKNNGIKNKLQNLKQKK